MLNHPFACVFVPNILGSSPFTSMEREARTVEFRLFPLWKLSQIFKKLVLKKSRFLRFARTDKQDIALDKAFSLLRRGEPAMGSPADFTAAFLDDLVLGEPVSLILHYSSNPDWGPIPTGQSMEM